MRNLRKIAIVCVAAFILNLVAPNFNVNVNAASNLDMLLNIENPVNNHQLTDSFFVKGWALSENDIEKVEVYLDNKNIGQANYGIERNDIYSNYPEYSNSLKSGFTMEVKGVSNGNHTLKVVATDKKGVTKESSVTISNNSNKTVIMGTGKATKEQMISLLSKRNPSKETVYIADFVEKTIEEAKIEGVNADILFAQMMHETGFLKFGGDVKEEQNNFAGLGATGNGVPGESFESVQIGIRAVVQHLKAYASTEPLKQACVDNRFKYVERGSALYVEHLGIKENPKGKGWAANKGYGYYLLSLVDELQNEAPKYISTVSGFNVSGSLLTGENITLSATANPSSDSLYKFAYRDDSTGQWITVKDYGVENKVTFKLDKAGSYRFVVHVKHKTSSNDYDSFDFIDKNINKKEKLLSFDVSGNMSYGSNITISAKAESKDALYKFGIRNSKGEWITIQDYSTKNTINYKIDDTGDLRIVVHVKNKLSPNEYDDFDFKDFVVGDFKSKLTSFDLNGEYFVNSTINISATSSPTAESLYKFAIRDPQGNWITIKDYNSVNSMSYKFTKGGDYRIVVHTKHKNSSNEYDDFDFKDIKVTETKSSLSEFKVGGYSYIGRNVDLSAKATPSNSTLYKFAIRKPDGVWETIKDYNSTNSFSYVPNEPGEYRFVVHVKSNGSSQEYDDFDFKDVVIKDTKADIVSFNVIGENYIGNTLNINALSNPSKDVLYKFAVRDPQGVWTTIKDYGKETNTKYYLSKPGEYRFVIHSKYYESPNEYDDFEFVDIKVGASKSTINQFEVKGDPYVDRTLSISAKATPSDKTLYKFGIRKPDGTWVTIKDYSNSNSMSYIPKEEGNYRFVVHVKHVDSPHEYDEFDFKDFNITKTEVKLKSFIVNGDLKPNKTVSLSAATDKPQDTLYKFAIRDPKGNWITIKDYNSTSSASYVPVIEGDYRFVVHVKHKASEKEYDDFDFRDFTIRESKLIVVDAGHNYGGDDGAYATHGSTTYVERDLNMAVAEKVKNELEKKGFNVVMTRNPEDRDYIAMRESLKRRVDLANSLDADFFVSIHHNTVGVVPHSATGVEIYYSSAAPLSRGLLTSDGREVGLYGDVSNKGITNSKIDMSVKVGTEMVNAISNEMGRVNRGLKDDDFYVVKNTFMPSLLVECGFISNAGEASLLANSSNQQKMAEIIARTIANNL